MKSNLLSGIRRIHAVGIGGIGLSALVGILIGKNKVLSGSDEKPSQITRDLGHIGIKINIGHKKENVPPSTQRVIYSLAIPPSNPELKFARQKHIPILSYPEAVGLLTQEYFTIAISGTHGKSTTTSMIAKILIENNFDPTVIVGTQLKELGGRNFRIGKSKILVLEACEYKRAFLNYSPRISVVHTLDPDHLDYYRDFDDYLSAFEQFALKLPLDGYFFANLDDEDIHRIFQALQNKKFPNYNTFTYGTKYSSGDFYLDGNRLIHRESVAGVLDLKIPGEHNRSNALAAFSVCAALGIAPKKIINSLNKYAGSHRRFELKGRFGKTEIIDDYAHHPAEIRATLQAARERFADKKICAVFQPHQYNRTKKLFNEFADSFGEADCIIIPNIYEVRDTKFDKKSVTAQSLVEEIQKRNPHTEVVFGEGLEKTAEFLKKNSKKFTAIITMGAGDVWKTAEALIKASVSK